jgi:hypothetical protein
MRRPRRIPRHFLVNKQNADANRHETHQRAKVQRFRVATALHPLIITS